MGFFNDLGNAISGAVDAVGDAVSGAAQSVGNGILGVADFVADVVEDVVNAVEEVVADVVETVGDLVADGLDAVGEVLSGAPLIGGILKGGFHWLGNVVSGITDLVGAIVKGGLGMFTGLVAGLMTRVVFGGIGGLLAWKPDLFMKGLGDIAARFVGAVVGIGAKAVSLAQANLFLEHGKRRLTKEEMEMLRRVFRSSLALYNVRVVPGFAGLYSVTGKPFTLGNTVYLQGSENPWDLVHEATHVWQYQNLGIRYTADSIWGAIASKVSEGDWELHYSWERELRSGKDKWKDFTVEAQARFLEDVYRYGRRFRPDEAGNGVFYEGDPVAHNVVFDYYGNHTDLARASVEYVRGAFAWRLSTAFDI